MNNEKEDLIPRVGKTYELQTFFSLLNIHDRTENMGSDFREKPKVRTTFKGINLSKL